MNVPRGEAPYTLVKVHGSVSWARSSRLMLPPERRGRRDRIPHGSLDHAEELLERAED